VIGKAHLKTLARSLGALKTAVGLHVRTRGLTPSRLLRVSGASGSLVDRSTVVTAARRSTALSRES